MVSIARNQRRERICSLFSIDTESSKLRVAGSSPAAPTKTPLNSGMGRATVAVGAAEQLLRFDCPLHFLLKLESHKVPIEIYVIHPVPLAWTWPILPAGLPERRLVAYC
jgi:hypothetical protein